MRRSALRLVEQPLIKEEAAIWDETSQEGHSLHFALPYPDSFPPELVSYFVRRFTQKEDVVLDPFCGSGTTSLESALLGRVPLASDMNLLAVKIARAKLEPADLANVALRLQTLNLRRPITVSEYRDHFSAFYDINTFREIANLRVELQKHDDRVSRFIELVALSLLHGHSAGFFSVHTFPQVSVSPEMQLEMNIKRGQTPDYRAIIPRILRKTASVLRDGFPSFIRKVLAKSQIEEADARDLSFVQSGSVSLIVTAPPLPGAAAFPKDQWLRHWFTGVPAGQEALPLGTLDEWLEFMNESLFEFARVVEGGGRVVLDLREVKMGGMTAALDEEVIRMVGEALPHYWQAEHVLLHKEPGMKLQGVGIRRSSSRTRRILVLRRR